MGRIEQERRQLEPAAQAPMDGDSKPSSKDELANESIAVDKQALLDSNFVQDQAERQARNSDIMKELD